MSALPIFLLHIVISRTISTKVQCLFFAGQNPNKVGKVDWVTTRRCVEKAADTRSGRISNPLDLVIPRISGPQSGSEHEQVIGDGRPSLRSPNVSIPLGYLGR